MRGLLTLAVVATASPLEGERDLATYSHGDYVKEFRNGALTADADGSRQATFEQNLELIKAHNANPTKTWFASQYVH